MAKLPTGKLRLDEHTLQKQLLESSLYEYVKYMWSSIESAPFIDNFHVEAVCSHLAAVTTGQIPRLLINMPPGTSKSLLTGVFWPTWEWTRDPSIRWFYASYDQKLTIQNAVRSRTLLGSSAYQQFWGGDFHITHDANQKTYYANDKGGYRLATSVAGHGTGQHPDRIIGDDPHNANESESEAERQAVIDWWDRSITTRGVSRGARRVIVMQRLHHHDLSAHVLAQGGYEHLLLPMRYESERARTTCIGWTDPRKEEGELLAPIQFDEDMVCEMERRLGVYDVAGQLQQRPAPKTGGMFKEKYFNNRVRAAPLAIPRKRFWDRAATADGGCYTAGVLIGQDAEGRYFVEDCVHGQWEPDDRNEVMRATALRDRQRYGMKWEPTIYIEAEGGSSGRDAWKSVARALAGFKVYEQRVTGSKDTRAEPWASQLAAGNVYIVDGGASDGLGKATWDINGYVTEHCLFRVEPGKRLGKYKDQVDASTGAFNLFAGVRREIPLRVVPFGRKDPKNTVRLVVCNKDSLPNALIEDKRCILISLADPVPDKEGNFLQEPANHSIQKLIEQKTFQFTDHDIAQHQDSWDDPIPPYDQPVRDISFNLEMAKKVWAFILRKRSNPWEVIVIQDEGGRRAYSIACGLADAMWLDRNSAIFLHAAVDSKSKPDVNPYIIDQIKATKNMVPS